MARLFPLPIQLEQFLRNEGCEQEVVIRLNDKPEMRYQTYAKGVFKGLRQDEGHPLMVFLETGPDLLDFEIVDAAHILWMKPT